MNWTITVEGPDVYEVDQFEGDSSEAAEHARSMVEAAGGGELTVVIAPAEE